MVAPVHLSVFGEATFGNGYACFACDLFPLYLRGLDAPPKVGDTVKVYHIRRLWAGTMVVRRVAIGAQLDSDDVADAYGGLSFSWFSPSEPFPVIECNERGEL